MDTVLSESCVLIELMSIKIFNSIGLERPWKVNIYNKKLLQNVQATLLVIRIEKVKRNKKR